MGLIDKVLDMEEEATTRLILKASEKQKRINALLEEEGSEVRIRGFEVQMGKEPSVAFSIELHEEASPHGLAQPE